MTALETACAAATLPQCSVFPHPIQPRRYKAFQIFLCPAALVNPR